MSVTRHLDTASGRRLQLPNIDSADVVMSDVAGGLSRLCRFGAQTSEFYSVAQHAVLVATIVEQTDVRPDLALAALHHDSHEAYIGDMPRPFKDYVADASPQADYLWRNLERAFDVAIERAFDFRSPADRDDIALIKRADECALLMEASRLLPDTNGYARAKHGLSGRRAKAASAVADGLAAPATGAIGRWRRWAHRRTERVDVRQRYHARRLQRRATPAVAGRLFCQ